ncbi:TLP18.3/Psb32/MOLO-1 phosphatase superfamily protein [Dyadobacter jejuensis]|uniref:TLP18.3/Psb32/MOLO-1 phosphatase superfamily protein n=1 Tax=Dyadobacter jejuensis TaxID=1082580 RepID=A0A316AL20_9BACT|nr:TPM domain-containing protein [Dyadobacter jejuensis]PWJ57734.1 TLP18.3/Psb32/MOLO-1 phosphatase superfamily protein [Dyadobacter jejuensis]
MTDQPDFLSEADQQAIIAAIKAAEMQTSGEIKVHIEEKCPTEQSMERAIEVFGMLNMHQTEQRNGVLFYLAYGDRKFAVLGDSGIHEKVTDLFWNSTKDLLRQHFAKNDYAQGLCAAITEAGLQLKKHFPYQSDDINELPDDISFG